ncbi:nitroreductase family protein [Amycolatopsis rubida]|uniref:Nitroreductase family protein n=1 Tax=Amycolatopsis rubida TaxID=112413 RepID=A0ABX0BPS5_9PSEU|nr:nitroreductase family protein [Amycolatopsis sp. M39]MYW89876.1 nitroreductase [Amycolatopsis rubida]NEC54853.1 nitroreductase family protein [Amycolatopsis rubida]OAP26783.1 Nitroreductase family protein [Amycolatopsis sp. M39]
MDAVTLLTTTRSVRRKLDFERPVPKAVLEDCLRIAQQAPAAGSLLTAQRWVVVLDPAIRKEIAAVTREAAEEAWRKYAHLVGNRMAASARHLVEHLDQVPALVLPCMPGPVPTGAAELSAYYGSIYPAIWSFQLALRAHGLASSLCSYHLGGREADVARILGLPEDVAQIGLLAVAYSAQQEFSPAARPEVADILSFDGWAKQ